MGVREDGCNLKTIASIFKTDLRCQSYNPTCMGLGEVGRYPIEIEAKCRMLGFWYGLCSASHSESPKIFNLMFKLCSKLYYIMHAIINSHGL